MQKKRIKIIFRLANVNTEMNNEILFIKDLCKRTFMLPYLKN